MWFRKLKSFVPNEQGAVTVDFVVLTSVVVLLGSSVLLVIYTGLNSGSRTINDEINDTLVQAPDVGAVIISGQ